MIRNDEYIKINNVKIPFEAVFNTKEKVPIVKKIIELRNKIHEIEEEIKELEKLILDK